MGKALEGEAKQYHKRSKKGKEVTRTDQGESIDRLEHCEWRLYGEGIMDLESDKWIRTQSDLGSSNLALLDPDGTVHGTYMSSLLRLELQRARA